MGGLPVAPRWIPTSDADTWRKEASEWLNAGVAAAGLTCTGPIATVKRQPWSLVAQVPTSGGLVWFKANVPAQGHEAALLDLLAGLVPGSVPAPLAVEPEHSWLLLPDRGPTVRTLARDDEQDTWTRLVGQWAEVAHELASHAGELADLGVPSLRPEDAARYLDARIAELAGRPPTDPAHLKRDDARRLRAAVPVVAGAGDQLAALGLPSTLWHNDLHTNNVFLPNPEEELAYFDFGDALIGSPLAELLIPLRSFADARGVELSPYADVLADPDFAAVVDAAIEPWTDGATAAQLRAAVPAGLLLGVLGRSESWRRALDSAGPPDAEYGDATTAWLLELVAG